MSPMDLLARLSRPAAPILLHVLPPEIHAAHHILPSRNVCVYETAFLSKVLTQIPDKRTPLVVYGAGLGSLDAEVAAQRLTLAGYSSVEVFHGGLAAWSAAGLPLGGTGNLPEAAPLHGIFRVDTELSVLRWTGRNLFNHHHGTVRMAAGELELNHGELVSAHFQVDMQQIACEDLADSAWNAMLVQHLQDLDFFATDHHPTASFRVEKVQRIPEATEGTPQWQVQGVATIRDISQPVQFPVVVAASEDGCRITAQAQFELDRTQFGSVYGSGKLFRFLGKHVVNDHFHLHVKLHAERV